VRLGGGSREIFDAESLLDEYVGPRRPGTRYAYPHYDGLVTNGDPSRLVTGDLLAPCLIGVPVDARLMDTLVGLLPRLQAGLDALPQDVPLAEADDDLVARVAQVWAPLDEPDVGDYEIKGSLIAKVLHHKRPQLLPLYDSRVYQFYRGEDCIPVHRQSRRNWVDYLTRLCQVMRRDLTDNAEEFARLQARVPEGGPPLSDLRVLDIIVWMSSGV